MKKFAIAALGGTLAGALLTTQVAGPALGLRIDVDVARRADLRILDEGPHRVGTAEAYLVDRHRDANRQRASKARQRKDCASA